jgi:hypothetical protein
VGYGHVHHCLSGPSDYPIWTPLGVLAKVEVGVVLSGQLTPNLFRLSLPLSQLCSRVVQLNSSCNTRSMELFLDCVTCMNNS